MTPEQAVKVVQEIRLIDPGIVDYALARINLDIAKQMIDQQEQIITELRARIEYLENETALEDT